MGHDQSPPGSQWVIIGEDIESISGQRQDLTSLVRRIVAMPQPHIPSNMATAAGWPIRPKSKTVVLYKIKVTKSFPFLLNFNEIEWVLFNIANESE